jgi:hypothetical protein
LALWIQFLSPKPRRRPATLRLQLRAPSEAKAEDRSSMRSSLRLRPTGLRRDASRLILDGLCLHVLSSFQRTGLPVVPPIHSRAGRSEANLPTV